MKEKKFEECCEMYDLTFFSNLRDRFVMKYVVFLFSLVAVARKSMAFLACLRGFKEAVCEACNDLSYTCVLWGSPLTELQPIVIPMLHKRKYI